VIDHRKKTLAGRFQDSSTSEPQVIDFLQKDSQTWKIDTICIKWLPLNKSYQFHDLLLFSNYLYNITVFIMLESSVSLWPCMMVIVADNKAPRWCMDPPFLEKYHWLDRQQTISCNMHNRLVWYHSTFLKIFGHEAILIQANL